MTVKRGMGYSLEDVRIVPGEHSLMFGSTGSGKSTFAEMLLDEYHRRFPQNWVYIVDPKERFMPVHAPDLYKGLFPHGYRAVEFGRRRKVPIVGNIETRPGEPKVRETGATEAVLLQDEQAVWDTLKWLYKHSSVQTPSIVFLDESVEQMRGVRSHPTLRLLFHEGRELAIGVFLIHQQVRWIDSSWISEARNLYIGSLFDRRDRDQLEHHIGGAPKKVREAVEKPMPLHRWAYIDRVQWSRSKLFDVRLER